MTPMNNDSFTLYAVVYRRRGEVTTLKTLRDHNGCKIDDPRLAAKEAASDLFAFAFQMIPCEKLPAEEEPITFSSRMFTEGELSPYELFVFGRPIENMNDIPPLLRRYAPAQGKPFFVKSETLDFFPLRPYCAVLERKTGQHLLKITQNGRVFRQEDFVSMAQMRPMPAAPMQWRDAHQNKGPA